MSDEKKLYLYFAEFNTLKSEQLKRITTRDHCVYLNIIALGTACAMLVKTGHPASFLLIQWASLLLGWNHLINDLKVSDIGDYIKYKLSPKVEKIAGVNNAFEWEYFPTENAMRFARKMSQTFIDILVFFTPIIASGVCYFLYIHDWGKSGTLPFTEDFHLRIMDWIAIALMVLAVIYLVQLIYYSRYRKHKRKGSVVAQEA